MKIYLQEFTVEGHGHFPVDMLRRDQCWPAREGVDTQHVAPVFFGKDDFKATRRVTLHRHVYNKNAIPNAGRWASFGWLVDANSVRTRPI